MAENDQDQGIAGDERKAPWGLIVTAIIAILVLIFAFSNRETADFNFAGLGVEMPEWLLFLILVFIGVIIGWALSAIRRARKRP